MIHEGNVLMHSLYTGLLFLHTLNNMEDKLKCNITMDVVSLLFGTFILLKINIKIQLCIQIK